MYNLTVEGPPEFFANDILVHNCSATRYCLYGLHDIYMDSGAQSPEQAEAVRIAAAASTAPTAKRYHDEDSAPAELAQDGWRSQF